MDERDKWLDIYGHSLATGENESDPMRVHKPLAKGYDLVNVLMYYSEGHFEEGPAIQRKDVVPKRMSVDDINDMFNGNIDKLKKKIGEKSDRSLGPSGESKAGRPQSATDGLYVCTV